MRRWCNRPAAELISECSAKLARRRERLDVCGMVATLVDALRRPERGFTMSATLFVRHTVADYDTWRKAYDGADALRAKHGCNGHRVMRVPGDPKDVAATHEFPTLEQAEAFANDPAVQDTMQQAGVTGPPRIEIFENA
jgi:hypothetical protein